MIPIDASIARAAQIVFVVAAVLGLIGLFARVAIAIATLSALYLFALPQLSA